MLDQYVNSLQSVQPNPWLSPIDVVKIHLDALQISDLVRDNQGIQMAYNFSSPLNKCSIGSLADYERMLRTPLYRALIGFERATLLLLARKQHTTDVKVSLQRREKSTDFHLSLSRQFAIPYAGCWMIDSVVPTM